MSRIEPISVCPALASAIVRKRRNFAQSLAASNAERTPVPSPVSYDLVLAAQNDEVRRSRLQRKPTPSLGRLIDLMA